MSDEYFLIECEKCGYEKKKKKYPFEGDIKRKTNTIFNVCIKCPDCGKLICKQYLVDSFGKKMEKAGPIFLDFSKRKIR